MNNSEVSEGFFTTVEKLAILLKVRSMAVKDRQIHANWQARREAIDIDPNAQATYLNFPTYPTVNDVDVKKFCQTVNAQLSVYRGKKGVYSRSWIMDAAATMPGYLWWDQNGGSTPELQARVRAHLYTPHSPPPL